MWSGTRKMRLTNGMAGFQSLPFLTNQKIISVIFWLVHIIQSDSCDDGLVYIYASLGINELMHWRYHSFSQRRLYMYTDLAGSIFKGAQTTLGIFWNTNVMRELPS